jgi:deoxyribodipyrimidine photo-lyase
MSQKPPILVWFRNDLRLDDHPALHHAAESGDTVIPVFLWTPESEGRWAPGGAGKWWLNHALKSLAGQLEALGSKLILRSGKNEAELLDALLKETGAEQIYWNRRYEPNGVKTDTQLKKDLPAKSFRGNLLYEPHHISNQSGDYYKVFTPFYKAMMAKGDISEPVDAPKSLNAPESWPESEDLEDFNLLPDIKWDEQFYDCWDPGHDGCREQVETFLDEAAGKYKDKRDYPGIRGTSRLSPYLHFGQVSSRRLWHLAQEAAEQGASRTGIEAWTRQLVWRDFATHLLFHQPQLDWEPMQEKFADFPWKDNRKWLKAWQRGQTGYPIVDAGMRELWATGWMHNRVRMIVASFLVKDLLIHWREGALWFWDTLVDADLPNNSFGWQWAGGCGADAAPYFRIFNPVLQSKKFDGSGDYIRRWVPELKNLSNKDIHAPWELDNPPKDYPAPIVDHSQARDRALEALGSLKD